MKLLCLDHSQLKVKGGHPPRFTFWCLKCFYLETSLCVLVTPPTTRLSPFDQRSYSQHSTMWRNTDTGEKYADSIPSIKNLSREISGLIQSENSPELVLLLLLEGWCVQALLHRQRSKRETNSEDEDDAQSSSLFKETICNISIQIGVSFSEITENL